MHVLHVIEGDVVAGEDGAELETPAESRALLDACVAELRAAGTAVTGEIVHTYGTHADVAERILRRAAELTAGVIVIGPDTGHLTIASGVTARVAARAPSHAIVVNPRGRAGSADPGGAQPRGTGPLDRRCHEPATADGARLLIA